MAKALIIAPAWVGDMVMAHALVHILARRGDFREIHMVAPPATAPLGRRMAGIAAVHRLWASHGQLALRRRWRLARRLRGQGFATAYVLPNSFKAALIPWRAKIPVRVGWRGEWRYGLLNDLRQLDARRHSRTIEQFAALGLPEGEPLPRPVPRPTLKVDPGNRAAALASLGLDGAKPITALCPGAEYGGAKRWPTAHFAVVAEALLRQGGTVWILGSKGDAAIGAEIARRAPGALDLTGRTRLIDAVDLLSLAEAAVTNDSGLMHVACALGVRVVALYGSTTPERTPPLGSQATALFEELDCRPCFRRECPLGHLNCLRRIAPERVLAALAACPPRPEAAALNGGASRDGLERS